MTARSATTVHWFRKGLRLHDNPALLEACNFAGATGTVYPIFIIDPHFAKPDVVGINRYAFLLQSLEDLDSSLRSRGSQLYVLRGKPEERLPQLFEELAVHTLTFETDTEPYARARDAHIRELAAKAGVVVKEYASHTLHDMEHYLGVSVAGSCPATYVGFQKLFSNMPSPRAPAEAPSQVPSKSDSALQMKSMGDISIPTLNEMGYPELPKPLKFPGESDLRNAISLVKLID